MVRDLAQGRHAVAEAVDEAAGLLDLPVRLCAEGGCGIWGGGFRGHGSGPVLRVLFHAA